MDFLPAPVFCGRGSNLVNLVEQNLNLAMDELGQNQSPVMAGPGRNRNPVTEEQNRSLGLNRNRKQNQRQNRITEKPDGALVEDLIFDQSFRLFYFCYHCY